MKKLEKSNCLEQTVIYEYASCEECPHYRQYEDYKLAYKICKDCPNNTLDGSVKDEE